MASSGSAAVGANATAGGPAPPEGRWYRAVQHGRRRRSGQTPATTCFRDHVPGLSMMKSGSTLMHDAEITDMHINFAG